MDLCAIRITAITRLWGFCTIEALLYRIYNTIYFFYKIQIFYEYNYCELFCLDLFKERDPDNKNIATFTMEEWVEKTLYS